MHDRQGVATAGSVELIERPTAPCLVDCLCNGLLTADECDRRTDGLWADILSVPRRARR